MARDIPAADDDEADHGSAEDVIEARAEIAVLEYEGEERAGDGDGDGELDQRQARAGERGDHRRQVLPRHVRGIEIRGDAVDGALAPDREEALQRHVRGDPEEDEHDERLEAAGAEAHQGLAAAPGSERHAHAEEEAAEDVRKPGEVRPHVDRLGEVDQPRELQRVRAEDRDRDGEKPHAHPRPASHVDDVGHRAHGAEVRAVGDRAEDEGEQEPAERDDRAEMGCAA